MHLTSLKSGEAFAETYGAAGKIVVDIGGQDVNGSLRVAFESRGMTFICVDMVEHPSVDIVIPPGNKLPFDNESVDIIVSTSCFEHDPCFWLTFKEMTRITKKDGFIYVNAPTGGFYHGYPGDNWRFFPDAGQALAYWSGKQLYNEEIYPAVVVETFNVLGSIWNDFVCIWKRVSIEEKTNDIVVPTSIRTSKGILELAINRNGFSTRKTVPER